MASATGWTEVAVMGGLRGWRSRSAGIRVRKMRTMSKTLTIARSARRRRQLRTLLRTFGLGMLFASFATGAAALVDRGFALGLAWPVLAAPGALTLLGFVTPALLRREPLERATIELDQNLGLADRVTTGVAFAGLDDAGPFETLAQRDAEAAAEAARLREGVPVRATRVHHWWPLTTAAAVALAVWLPALAPRGAAQRVETAAQRQERSEAQEQISSALEDAALALEEQPELFSEQTRRELEALERIEEELAFQNADPEEARAQAAEALADAAEEIEQLAQADERAVDATSDRFERAGGAEDPLGDALAEGDFARAADELAALEESLAGATPEERERLGERLREVAENIDTSDADQPPTAEERLAQEGIDPALAEEIAAQDDGEAVRERLEREGADPIEAQRIAEQLRQDAQEREAQEQAQRNAQEFREALEQAAGQCENPGEASGENPSAPPGEQGEPNAGEQGGDQGGDAATQGGAEERPGQPEQQGQPGASGLQEAQRLARELQEQGDSAGAGETLAERLREQANGISQRPSSGDGSAPEAGVGSAPPTRTTPPPPNRSLQTDSVNARRGADSTRVTQEIEARGPALPERRATSEQAERTLREAAPSAERAIESQGVPARYREMVRPVMSVRFDQPAWLLVALLAIPALVIALRWLRGMSRWRAWSCALARATLLVLVAAALAGASAVRTSERIAVIALVDVSDSLRRDAAGDALGRARAWIGALAQTMDPDDFLGVAAFSGRAVAVAAPARGGLEADDLTLDLDLGDATDLAGAIELAAAMAPPDAVARVVIFSDGVETAGEALASATALATVRVDAVPVEYRVGSDVIVERVLAPQQAVRESSVPVRVTLRSAREVAGSLLLKRNNEFIDLNGDAEGLGLRLTLRAGENTVLRDVPLGDGGVHQLEVFFDPDDPGLDAVSANNSAGAVVITPGRGRALHIDGAEGGGGRALAGVLRDAGFEVTGVAPEEAPTGLLELHAYDLVVLHDVAADQTPRAAHAALASYAQRLGGGLLVVGGPESLGAGGWNGTPLEPVLPVKLDLPEDLIVPSAAIVMVLDSSGSMSSRVMGGSRSQQEIANEAAALAAQTLDRTDLVGAIGFADGPYTVVPLGPNRDPDANGQRLRSISSGGGTNMYPAIREAGEWLLAADAEVKHIIVLSDGQSSGNAESGVEHAERMRESGLSITTIAVGDGADHVTLQRIAQAGGGEFYAVSNPNLLPRIFVREIRIVRKPLVREEPFTPMLLPSGSPITSGLGALPALQGLVLTQQRPEPEITLAMATGSGEPVLAHWNTGLGRVAVFTSDAHNWASGWLGWPGFRAMWTQAARYAARPPMSRDAELGVALEGDTLSLRLDAADDDGAPINLLRVPAVVYTPDGKSVSVELAQTGPGLYEASVPASASGTYVVAATPRRGEQALAPSLVGVSKPAGLELRSLESNAPRLAQIAEATGGGVYDLDDPARASEIWDRSSVEPVAAATPLWPLLLLWALGVYMVDIATRRVAWDRLLRREVATARRLTEGAQGTTAAAWKAAKRRTEPTPPSAPAEAPAPAAGGGELAARRRRVENAIRQTSGEAPGSPDVREPGGEAEADARSGLLAAKRRASRRFDEHEET
ncbi:unnamed protein product [Cladocopium goreaui]|uniref:VWA domain-containing protein n=1 Tax=Cladocopium goreaui TaxID=2562237 RepID=A0A9P1DJ53_9DINO|nr:unnamed protein product [Cladocopium goreaui]